MEQQTTTTPVQAKVKLSPVMDLIKRSLSIYKKVFVRFVGMALIPFLGLLPLVIILGLYMLSARFLSGIPFAIVSVTLGILGIAAVIFIIAIYLSAQAGLILLIKNFEAGQKIKEAFLEGKKYAWEFLIVNVLTGILVLLWGLLLIIPGVIFFVYYIFSKYVLINENIKGMAALRRSKELVKGYWWAVFGRYLVVAIVIFLIVKIASIPFSYLQAGSIGDHVWGVVVRIIQLVLSPIAIIYSFLIYKELVERKSA